MMADTSIQAFFFRFFCSLRFRFFSAARLRLSLPFI
jgi:hypothetical protein